MLKSPRKLGFTILELSMGLIVTSLVLGALAAFTLAVSKAWAHSADDQSAFMLASQASARFKSQLQDARRTGYCQAGSLAENAATPAAMVYWVKDVNNDGTIQFSETALLKHDPASKTIKLFQPKTPVTTETTYSTATFESAVAMNALTDAARSIGNTALNKVSGAYFAVLNQSSATVAPTFHYNLNFKQGDENKILPGAVTLRAPAR